MTASRLDVLKTLGDNTRYAIYLEIARSPAPLATADIADTLGLHVNTVRPHLERMRELNILQVHTTPTGGVGRPQHRYSLAPGAPSLGLEPPLFPMLARLLLEVAAEVGADDTDAIEAGRRQGRVDANRAEAMPCIDALARQLELLGFDPEVVSDDEIITIGFAHCPFASLAEANPELVCGLHRGMVEGFVERLGGADVQEFRSLVDRNACQVDLVVSGGAA